MDALRIAALAVPRFGLAFRMLGLLAAAIVPALAALLYVQIELRHERVERLSEGALRQAMLVAADLNTLVDASRQLTQAIARSYADPATPGCSGAPLEMLRSALGGYAGLAVVAVDGRVVCSAALPAPGLGVAWRNDLAAARRSGQLAVGHYTIMPGARAVLPIFLPFVTAAGERRTVVAAIDLRWLAARMGRFLTSAHNSLNIADDRGTILVRLPDPDRWRGRLVAPAAQALVVAPMAGTRDLIGVDGVPRRTGYVPAAANGGLYVASGIYVPDMLAAIDEAARRGYLLIAAGAVASLLLMLVITRRLVHLPTEALLRAASRWTSGDLAARASLHAPEHTEFGRLASAFNMMAQTLDTRRSELQELNASLEARVEERTTALSQANNRLLIEISERERTDAALRQSQKLRAVGHLAGGLAHEFNNLLTTVLGSLELLRMRLPEPEKALRLIGHAQEAAQRGGRLTGQLLAFARRRSLVTAPLDLNEVLTELRELLAGTLGRTIPLKLSLAPGLWPVLADRHEIEAAILNLVLNARDAMAQTVTIATRNAGLPQGEAAQGDAVELSVHDDGTGMNEHELSHAVDPFFTTKSLGEGVGLGLSQVHGLVQQLGGALRIASAPGQGAELRLFLPRADPAAALPSSQRPAFPPGGQLLLVDDDAEVRQIAAAMLGELGYKVVQAASAPAALALLEGECASAAILVTDYAMPEVTGADLIRTARRRRPQLRTLLITGYMHLDPADEELLQTCKVLRKPFTLQELRRRLGELAAAPAA